LESRASHAGAGAGHSDGGTVTALGQRRDLLPVLILVLLGSLAFMNLMAIPAFEDEGSQLRWIWRIVEAGSWREPLADGKPLEAWPMVPLFLMFPQPLWAIRAVHVLAGICGAVLTYRLALQLGSRGRAFACGALFAICPFVVYLQRLALSDIFMCSAGVWVLIRGGKFVVSPTWLNASVLAGALVLAALCKLPVGLIFLLSMPMALPALPAHERRQLLQPAALGKLLSAHAPGALLALAVIVAALLQLQRGRPAGLGVSDLMGIGMGRYTDIAAVIGVAHVSLIEELTTQLSWPVTVIAAIGLVAGAILGDWRERWLLAVGVVPMLGIGLLANFWYSRYLLFTLPPLIICAVSGWHHLALRARRQRYIVEPGVLAVCLGFMGVQSARIIADPIEARWSPVDRFQYFDGWGSGYGYPQAAKFLMEAPDVPAMIYSLDGHSAFQLLTYLPPEWSHRVKTVFYARDGTPLRSDQARLENIIRQGRAWIIVSQQLLDGYLDSSFGPSFSSRFGLRQIAMFDKPGARARLAVYEVMRR
jgi:hypothetical protein